MLGIIYQNVKNSQKKNAIIKKRIFRNKRNFKTIGTDEMSLKDEFYKKIVKNEDSEEFINWVIGVEDENELDN